MRIIFLDIDGVLNSENEPYEGKLWRLSESAILRVNTIIERTDARIVLTSDWRRYHGLQRCAEVLRAHGLSAEIVDATPNLENRRTVHEEDFDPTAYFERLRRSEIEAWMKSHDIQTFVVIDDLAVFERDHPNMILTNATTGLTAEDAARAIAVLCRPTG
jgi:hypothetical protein